MRAVSAEACLGFGELWVIPDRAERHRKELVSRAIFFTIWFTFTRVGKVEVWQVVTSEGLDLSWLV